MQVPLCIAFRWPLSNLYHYSHCVVPEWITPRQAHSMGGPSCHAPYMPEISGTRQGFFKVE